MADRRFECQIAKGQIGRYLAGDAFSAEAMRQLEEHIADCLECKTYLNDRKSSLQSMLGQPRIPAPPEPEVSTPATEATPIAQPAPKIPFAGMEFFGALTKAMQPRAAAKPEASFWKTFGYSIALALVLGGMSLVSRNMSAITGQTVLAPGASLPTTHTLSLKPQTVDSGAAAQPLKPRVPIAHSKPKPKARQRPLLTSKPAPNLAHRVLAPTLDVPGAQGKPSAEALQTPKTEHRRTPRHLEITVERRRVRPAKRHHHPARPIQADSVRVYGPDGADLSTEQ